MKISLYRFIFLLGIWYPTSACSQQSSTSPKEIIPPEPYTYFPISFHGGDIELWAQIDTVTPITLINHQTGSVAETLTAKTGRRNDDYRGQYAFTSLAASPSWNSTENYINKVSSITAMVGVPYSEVEAIYPVRVDDQELAGRLDKRIRKEAALDSALRSMGNKKELAEDYHKALEGKTPKLFEVYFGDRKILLISYELARFSTGYGPKLLLVEDKIIPLMGSCASLPLFYSIGEHLYFRLLTSLCETGYILVGNYVVLNDTVKLEWATADYAN